MRFNENIHITVNKAMHTLGLINRTYKEMKSIKIVKTSYLSLVRSKLMYALCVWSPFFNVYIKH